MDSKQSIRGLLLGVSLGLTLWLIVAFAMFYTIGFAPRMLPYLWWLVGILMIYVYAAAQIALAWKRGELSAPPERWWSRP